MSLIIAMRSVPTKGLIPGTCAYTQAGEIYHKLGAKLNGKCE